jgi:hypothetical protein
MAEAMYELGRLHMSDKCGGNKDRALTWLIIGGRFGSGESKAAAEKLERLVSPQQKKQAHLNAEQWISKHPGADQEEEQEEKR